MIPKIVTKRIVKWLVKNGSILEKESEVHEFGMDKLFSNLTNLAFAVCIGNFFGILPQTMVFYIVYFFLRVYAGGYHADTRVRCFILSIVVIVPCLLIIKYLHFWYFPTVFYSVLLLCVIVLGILSPVDNINKILDNLERKVYRFRLLRNLVICFIGAVSLHLMSFYDFSSAVLCALILTTIMAVIGKIRFARLKVEQIR